MDDKKLYNVLLPIWLLVFFPSYLWLILIPANYLIDRIVMKWSLGDMPDKGMFCRKHTWKICLAGFLSDFAGAAVMLSVALLLGRIEGDGISFLEKAGSGIMFDPFSNILAFLITAAAVALSAFCIFKLDKLILRKTGLETEQVRRVVLRMALFTAPYLYLIPSRIIY